MTNQILTKAVLLAGAAIALIVPAQASLIIASYDSPNGYDFVNTSPPSGSTTIGTFTFTPIPAGELSYASLSITGSFGNPDGSTTALSDYFLGFSGDEEAVEVASCDNSSLNCYSGQEGPYSWTATLTAPQIALLAPALQAGSIDFSYVWGSSPPLPDFFAPTGFDLQNVYAGAATLAVTVSPEPATVLICFSGLAGVVVLRRFRKV
jgi:hypothetical protein